MVEAKFSQLNPTSKLHFQKIHEKVERLFENGAIVDRSHGLIFLFLSVKFKVDIHAFDDCITDGGNDLGVDAIYITRLSDGPEIHVIQSKFHDSERKASNAFKTSAMHKFRDFLRTVKNREADLDVLANPVLKDRILEIRELLKDEFPRFKLWCISNGKRTRSCDIDEFSKEVSMYDAEIDEFHLSEFYNLCIAGRSKRTDHSFYTHGNEVVEFSGGSVKGILGLISAAEIYKLVVDITEPGKIDFGLFDQNIRGFLGADNQINRQIYRSAVSDQNARFWCLNNGITLTCSKFEVRRMATTPKVGAKDLCIVNGAQTCGAIFQAWNDFNTNNEKFKNLAVSFRLYETSDPHFVEDIAISSNSQNRVSSRDLKANHVYQFQVESELENRGIRYLRKRGITDDYVNISDEEERGSIDALKVGQIILSYHLNQPERAKRDSDKIFESLYDAIFANIDWDSLEFAIRLYWKIMGYRAKIEEEIRIKNGRSIPRDFITYGVFHVLYACKILLQRDVTLKNSQTELVEQAIDLVDDVLSSAGRVAHYSFFRRSQTGEAISNYGVQPDLFSQLN